MALTENITVKNGSFTAGKFFRVTKIKTALIEVDRNYTLYRCTWRYTGVGIDTGSCKRDDSAASWHAAVALRWPGRTWGTGGFVGSHR